MSREDNIDREARELWLTLRGEEAPKGLTGSDLLLILVAQAQEMRYDRYVSPHLRESQISRPRSLSASGNPGRDGQSRQDRTPSYPQPG